MELQNEIISDETTPGGWKAAPDAGPAESSAAPAPSASDAEGPGARGQFIAPASAPTQLAPHGIRYDFNDGCRLLLPKSDPPWTARIRDLDTGNILFQTRLAEGFISSSKRYFVRGRFEVEREGETVFAHDYDATGREILINFPVGTLGDTMGWFPYAARFAERRRCKLTCALAKPLIPLFRDAYPDITLVEASEVDAERFYATYNLGLFFDDTQCLRQPCDFRHVGLHRTAGYILGVDPREVAPRLAISEADSRPLQEPYVCIATQATSQAKYWNNPEGWRKVILFLKRRGYRVLCVDQKPLHGQGLIWNHIPHGAEDFTGLSLQECARYLKHSALFVGLSSGLSWLAWAAGAKIVLISGFSHPSTEFDTPGRVINWHACNSCWNDPALRFDHKDFLWCPRHRDTPRQFECTRLITPEHVTRVIEDMPGFSARVLD